MAGWTDGCVEVWIVDGLRVGQMDGWLDGRTDV